MAKKTTKTATKAAKTEGKTLEVPGDMHLVVSLDRDTFCDAPTDVGEEAQSLIAGALAALRDYVYTGSDVELEDFTLTGKRVTLQVTW